MGNSSLIVSICGRDALPVRAIPIISGWTISPDRIAEDLSHSVGKPLTELEAIAAYHLHGDVPVKLLPKEWDSAREKLDALYTELKEQFPAKANRPRSGAVGYVKWKRQSLPLLPPGTFVWLDEFTQAYEVDFSESRRDILGERAGDRNLIFTPLLEEGQLELILEGFSTQSDEKPIESQKDRRARWLQWFEEEKEQRGNRGAVTRVHEREKKLNPKADRSRIGKEIKKAGEERDRARRDGDLFNLVPTRRVRLT